MKFMPEVSSGNPFAVIAAEDIVLGFKALGFKVYGVKKEATDLVAVLEEIIKQGTAVCLMQEDIYAKLEEQIKSYAKQPLPVFIPFSKGRDMSLLDKVVKDIRIRATGAW